MSFKGPTQFPSPFFPKSYWLPTHDFTITLTFNTVQEAGISLADPEILSCSPTVDLALKDCHTPENLGDKDNEKELALQHMKTDNKL